MLGRKIEKEKGVGGALGATAFGIPALMTVQPVLQAHTAVGFVK